MASRVKKLFRRKKDDSPIEQEATSSNPPGRLHKSSGATSNSTVRHSLYENAVPGMYPETGDYPLRGSSGSQYDLPKGKGVGRHTASTGDLTYSQPLPRNRESHERPATSRRSRDPSLSRDFTGLNLTEGPQTQESLRAVDLPPRNSLPAHYGEDIAGRNVSNNSNSYDMARDPGYVPAKPKKFAPYSSANMYDHNAGFNIPDSYDYSPTSKTTDSDTFGQSSVQRKQVGSGPPSRVTAPRSNPMQIPTQHNRQASLQKPLPTPMPELERPDTQQASVRKVTNSSSANVIPAADVIQRAKTNTYDTEVIEKIAPAVVHETVHRDVHHVREEVITREIHNHEVYHRILPVIDIEVLPPRHFLPVQGGGLVEISADEVPSRGCNWVIAETASKIPSDESAPLNQRRDRFSARQFIGTEGDAKRYTTPGGWEKTEQTWVHPPELETGAKDSGQTWPMDFEALEEGRKHTKSPSGGKHHCRHRSSMKQPTMQNE